MKKKNENKIQISEYWESLNTSIKVFFIVSCILFIAEMVAACDHVLLIFISIRERNYNFNIVDVYSVLFPFLYFTLNLLFVLKRKLTIKTILILMILRITYPYTLQLIGLIILVPIMQLTGGFG